MRHLLISLLFFTLLLVPYTMNAQTDSITVVEYEWQKGDNLLTVWNKYGQKFKLKEYLEYNPTRSKYKSPQPGDKINIAVHSAVKEKPLSSKFKNKLTQKLLGIEADDTQLSKQTQLADAESVEAKESKPSKEKSKKNDKTEPRIKLTWASASFSDNFNVLRSYVEYRPYNLLGENIAWEFSYYDANQKFLFKTDEQQNVEKEKKKHTLFRKVDHSLLPHVDGHNIYYFKATALSPFDESVIMAESELKKFSIQWQGDLAMEYKPETNNDEPGFFESLLNLAVDVSSVIPGAKEKHEKTIAESPWLMTDAEKAAQANSQSTSTRASLAATSGTFKGDFAPYYSLGSNFKVLTPDDVATMSEDQRQQLEKVLQDAITDCGGQIFQLDDERRKLRNQKHSATAKAVDASIAARRNHNAIGKANQAKKQANVQAGHTSVGTMQIDKKLEALFARKDALTANLYTVQNRSGEAFTSAKDIHEAGARRILNAQEGIKAAQDNYRANERLYNSYANTVDKMDKGLIDYNEQDYNNAKDQMRKIRNDNNSREGYTKIPKSSLED